MWGSNVIDVVELTKTKLLPLPKALSIRARWAAPFEAALLCTKSKNSIVRSVCQDSRCAQVIMVTTCRKYLTFQSQCFLRSVLASSCWSGMSRVIHKMQPNTSEQHKTCASCLHQGTSNLIHQIPLERLFLSSWNSFWRRCTDGSTFSWVFLLSLRISKFSGWRPTGPTELLWTAEVFDCC